MFPGWTFPTDSSGDYVGFGQFYPKVIWMESMLSFLLFSIILAQKYTSRPSTNDAGLRSMTIGIAYASMTAISNGTKTMIKTGCVFNPFIALANTTV